MSQSVPVSNIEPVTVSTWTKHDTMWMLGLYGTAIGAGTLFLPINAGIGGLWPLILMAILAYPLTHYAHRGMTRFVLASRNPGADITEVVEEYFGSGAGKIITLLYFFAIYPIVLVYSVAVTNTVLSFIQNQLGVTPPPRVIVSLILILLLMAVVRLGKNMIVKAMSMLVYPFVICLMLLAFYLIPNWNASVFHQAGSLTSALSSGAFYKTMWLAIPVMVFSFNHSPIISSFAVSQEKLHGKDAERLSIRVLKRAHIMMVISVMFFVFSCVFSLSPADLMAAKAENISILSYLANHFHQPVIEWIAPIIAFVAICKSFLGHYLGAEEGFNGLVTKVLRQQGKSIAQAKMSRITAVFMFITTWAIATYNPSILDIIETLGGPVIAILLFLMPMYAIARVPAMKKYSGAVSNIFVVIIGLIAISAIFYTLFA